MPWMHPNTNMYTVCKRHLRVSQYHPQPVLLHSGTTPLLDRATIQIELGLVFRDTRACALERAPCGRENIATTSSRRKEAEGRLMSASFGQFRPTCMVSSPICVWYHELYSKDEFSSSWWEKKTESRAPCVGIMAEHESDKSRFVYTINGVKVVFPCKAYPTQLSMMNMVGVLYLKYAFVCELVLQETVFKFSIILIVNYGDMNELIMLCSLVTGLCSWFPRNSKESTCKSTNSTQDSILEIF